MSHCRRNDPFKGMILSYIKTHKNKDNDYLGRQYTCSNPISRPPTFWNNFFSVRRVKTVDSDSISDTVGWSTSTYTFVRVYFIRLKSGLVIFAGRLGSSLPTTCFNTRSLFRELPDPRYCGVIVVRGELVSVTKDYTQKLFSSEKPLCRLRS